jgi:hypothetical protein
VHAENVLSLSLAHGDIIIPLSHICPYNQSIWFTPLRFHMRALSRKIPRGIVCRSDIMNVKDPEIVVLAHVILDSRIEHRLLQCPQFDRDV